MSYLSMTKILIFTKKSTHVIDLKSSPFCLEESREGEPSQNQEAWENGGLLITQTLKLKPK